MLVIIYAYMQLLYEEIIYRCGDFSSIGLEQADLYVLTWTELSLWYYSIYCTEMINAASRTIGNVNIYNIYEPCINTLPPQRVSKMRYMSQACEPWGLRGLIAPGPQYFDTAPHIHIWMLCFGHLHIPFPGITVSLLISPSNKYAYGVGN